ARGGWDMLPRVVTATFRDALCILSLARLYVGPEGGLHHAAAALGVPAVVIFGGFSSPRATGYPWHSNIAAPGKPCGSIAYCAHCREAMASITVERVLEAARAGTERWRGSVQPLTEICRPSSGAARSAGRPGARSPQLFSGSDHPGFGARGFRGFP